MGRQGANSERLEVAVLEAGRKLDPLKDYTEHTWPYELKVCGFGDRSDIERTHRMLPSDFAILTPDNHPGGCKREVSIAESRSDLNARRITPRRRWSAQPNECQELHKSTLGDQTKLRIRQCDGHGAGAVSRG